MKDHEDWNLQAELIDYSSQLGMQSKYCIITRMPFNCLLMTTLLLLWLILNFSFSCGY